jgi:hypothetical protein
MAKFPSKIGACIDLAYTLRAERLEYQREVEAKLEKLKDAEKAINDHIVNTFQKSDINGAKGAICSASLNPFTKASAKDWPAIWAFIAKNKAWDLLEKRIANKAFCERLEAGQTIPGIERFDGVKLSLTKYGEKKALE